MRIWIVIFGMAIAPRLCHAQQVFIGNKGQLNTAALGCPDKQDASTFADAQASAIVAKDQIGSEDAINTALSAGCMPFETGDTGLVIDSAGWVPRFDRIRMDADKVAYWIDSDFISPIPGQPNNP